ncbi:MAG: hypothetical protein U0736_11580 [Gemmataceae bacterium]
MSAVRACGLLAVALLACGAGAAWGASELQEPYRIRVVVHMERHRLLTGVFREQVARELHDGMQAALGEAAHVEVTDSHPQLVDIRKRGLTRSLDGYRDRSGELLFFALVAFTGSEYEIRTRGYNGLVGLPSPVVRRGSTADRPFVARTAALLLERDLGLTGIVVSEPDGQRQVRVELRGGDLGVDFGRWVKKDELFALVRQEGTAAGVAIPAAVLQVVDPPRGGMCRCHLFSRFRLASVTGLRCVLLGTRAAPLRLRLLQEKPGGGTEPLRTAVTLQVRRHGFEGEDSSRLLVNARPGRDIDTSRDGPKGVFNRIAFVSVLTGETLRARIPVPLVDDSQQVLVLPATNEEGDLIAFRVRSLFQNVINASAVQFELFEEINALTVKPERRGEALAKVRQTLQRLQQDHTQLMSEYEEVRKEVEKLPPAERMDLAPVVKRLQVLKSGEAALLRTTAQLEKIEKEENDPKRKEWMIQLERARLLEKEGEIEQAIAIYEKAPEAFRTKDIQQHLAELKKLWEPRDDAHRAARLFIYEAWPALDTAGLKARIAEAHKALAVCKAHDDFLGAARLLRGSEKHAQRILKELNELKPDVNIDDEKPARLIQELIPELRKLDTDARAFLAKQKEK